MGNAITRHALSMALAVFGVLPGTQAFAAGEYKSALVLGLTTFSGNRDKSLVGSSEKVVSMVIETYGTRLRLTSSADFGFASGDAYFSSQTSNYSMFTAAFNPGVAIFPFRESSFQPYVSVKGIFGLHRFTIDTPTDDVGESSQSMHYGYEVTIGTDLRFRKGDKGSALRIFGSVRTLQGTIGEVTGFDLGGFRFGAGIVF